MRVSRIAFVALLAMLATASALLLSHASQPKTTLLVHAGAGIRPPLDELGALFEKRTGIRIDYSYKGSGCLLADICLSQRGDLYIPGESYYMTQARQKKFIVKDAIVAGMTMVLIVQPGNPKRIRSLQDLTRQGLRLGMGDYESVAAGKAAREALTRAGIFGQVRKNVIMTALNVIELGNAIKLGNLDAAIVWDATSALYTPREVQTITLPAAYSSYSPIPVGTLKFSKFPRESERFLHFLASPEAARIFRKHGYSTPGGQRPRNILTESQLEQHGTGGKHPHTQPK